MSLPVYHTDIESIDSARKISEIIKDCLIVFTRAEKTYKDDLSTTIAIKYESDTKYAITVYMQDRITGQFYKQYIQIPTAYTKYVDEYMLDNRTGSVLLDCVALRKYLPSVGDSIEAPFNRSCCVCDDYTASSDKTNIIDIHIDKPFVYTNTGDGIFITAEPPMSTISIKEPAGITSINGISPSLGNIDIQGTGAVSVIVKGL